MRQILLFACILSGLFACSIDEARPLANKKLVIASDFLYPKDAKYFASFEKEKKIKVEIVHMRADSMKLRMTKDQYNTKFDLLFVKSLSSVKELEDQPVQLITEGFVKSSLPSLQRIQENWFLAGKDPFVLTFLKDSLKKPMAYRELTTNYLWTSPDFPSIEVLKAQVTFQFQHDKKNKDPNKSMKNWMRGLKDHRVNYLEPAKNTKNTQLLLLTYRTYLQLSSQIYAKNRTVVIPEKPYCDYFAMAIVPQARNYASAKSFMSFWNENTENKPFLRKLRISPISSNSQSLYISPKEILVLLKERM